MTAAVFIVGVSIIATCLLIIAVIDPRQVRRSSLGPGTLTRPGPAPNPVADRTSYASVSAIRKLGTLLGAVPTYGWTLQESMSPSRISPLKQSPMHSRLPKRSRENAESGNDVFANRDSVALTTQMN